MYCMCICVCYFCFHIIQVLKNADLPDEICGQCAFKLVEFHEFRKMLLESHVKLLTTTQQRLAKGDQGDNANGDDGKIKKNNKHIAMGKKTTASGLLVCDLCKRAFKRRSTLQTHLFGIHFPHLKTKVSKKQCPYCPRWFNDIGMFVRYLVPCNCIAAHGYLICFLFLFHRGTIERVTAHKNGAQKH